MGLLDNIFTKKRSPVSFNPIMMPNSSANIDGLLRRWPKAPTRERGELPDLSLRNPRLDAVPIIARSIASTDFVLYDKRDLRVNPNHAEIIDESPIYELLERPVKRYPEIDGYALMYLTSLLVDLTGEFFFWKLRDDKGIVQELYPIPGYWVMTSPTVSNNYFMVYPLGTTSGNAIPISTDDMVWFKRMDPTDPYGRGRGTSEAIIDEVETDERLSKATKNLAFNDCTPPYFITAEGATQDQADAIKQNLMQKLGGWMHNREPGILTWANAKIERLAITPKEMDFVESRKYLRDLCLEHYQIPPEIYGVIENSNRSTIDAAYYLYHRNVLSDRYRFIERAINTQLIHQDFDKNLVGKFREVVPEDEDFKFKVVDAGFRSGALTRADWKQSMGFEVDDNQDNVYVLPMNMIEVPANEPVEAKPQATGEATSNTTENPSDELTDAAQSELENAAKSIVEYIQKNEAPDKVKITFDDNVKIVKPMKNQARREAIWKSFDARATSKEGEFIAAVKKYSGNQKPRVINALKSKELDTAIEKNSNYDKEINLALKSVFTPDANKALKSALAPAWLDSLESGRDHFYDMMGGGPQKAEKAAPKIKPSLTVTNKLFTQYVEEMGLLKAEGINDTTNDRLRGKLNQAISDGITNGDTLNTIKNSILDICEGVYDDMDNNRAKTIARTESAASTTAGTFITGKSEGMTQKQWLSVQDGRTRGSDPHDEFSHIDADGETVGIDEDFTATGESLAYPLDPKGSAGNCVNCRCSILLGNEDIPLESPEEE
jgi:phage portal protein BeeE